MPNYTIQQGDSLAKIAKINKFDLETLLSANPQIKDASIIRVGQKIQIPTRVADIPNKPNINTPDFVPEKVAQFISRARSASGYKTIYKLGAGGMNPASTRPVSPGNKCDCSGFVCWALGISRQTTHPLYRKFNGGWINTDGIVHDAKNPTGYFSQLDKAKIGCIIVFPGGRVNGITKIGHVGIVTAVKDGKASKVLHCSSGNYLSNGEAIQETLPTVFNRRDTIYAWYEGLS